ncbi:MAG: T9SS type A sorting domain-containing protein [Candidatus Eisenbacteria bacterium]
MIPHHCLEVTCEAPSSRAGASLFWIGLLLTHCVGPRGRWLGSNQWARADRCDRTARDAGTLFAGTAALGVFRSNDDGVSWSAANLGVEGERILCFARTPGAVLAGAEFQSSAHGGVFRSTNGGGSWIAAGLQGQTVFSLAIDNGFLYAGVGSGAARSTNGCASWLPANNGLFGASVYGLTVVDGTVFAAASQGMFRSDDHAASWSPGARPRVLQFLLDPVRRRANLRRRLRSRHPFDRWRPELRGLRRPSAGTVAHQRLRRRRPGSLRGRVRLSELRRLPLDRRGRELALTTHDIVLVSVNALAQTAGGLVAGSEARGLLRSTDAGLHWITSNAGLAPGGNLREMMVRGGDLFAATGGNGVWRSSDHGDSWTATSESDNNQLASELVFGLGAHGNTLFAGTSANGVYRSTTNGASWTRANLGLPLGIFSVLSLVSIDANVVAGTTDGIFLSTNDGGSWSLKSSDTFQCHRLASADGMVYALVSTGFGSDTGIYRSSNFGANWSLVLPAGGLTLTSLTANGANVYTGDLLAGMLRSTDHGLSWSSIDPAPGAGVFSIAARGNDLFAGCEPASDHLFRSTDRGSHWTVWNEGLPASASIEALALDTSYLFAGTDRLGTWRRVLPGATAVVEGPGFALVTWPNPVRDLLSLRLSANPGALLHVSLFDASGARVRRWISTTNEEGAMQLQLGDLPRGVYLVRAETGGSSQVARVVHVK